MTFHAVECNHNYLSSIVSVKLLKALAMFNIVSWREQILRTCHLLECLVAYMRTLYYWRETLGDVTQLLVQRDYRSSAALEVHGTLRSKWRLHSGMHRSAAVEASAGWRFQTLLTTVVYSHWERYRRSSRRTVTRAMDAYLHRDRVDSNIENLIIARLRAQSVISSTCWAWPRTIFEIQQNPCTICTTACNDKLWFYKSFYSLHWNVQISL